MTNRLNGQPSKEDMAKAMQELKRLAMNIYEMIEPGMSIVISLPEPSAIIVPGKPKPLRTIIITRPKLVMMIMPEGGL